jgi:hypothetical protein
MAPNTTKGTIESIVTNRQQSKNQHNRTSTIKCCQEKKNNTQKHKNVFSKSLVLGANDSK